MLLKYLWFQFTFLAVFFYFNTVIMNSDIDYSDNN